MELLRQIPAVLRFECRRTIVTGRLLVAIGLALLPASLVLLVQLEGAHLEEGIQGVIALYALLPSLTCLMCLLLWAVPIVHAEMEGRTWNYLAVRPRGKVSVLLGKYVAAVLWTVAVGWLGLLLCAMLVPFAQWLRTTAVLGVLVVFSTLAYGALFVLLGVVFLRRGMVVAVAYAFLIEFLTALIPAVIHQLTVQYHLRSLLIKWIELPLPQGIYHSDVQWLLGDTPSWVHVLALLAYAAVMLLAAVFILQQKELVKPEES